MDPPVPTRAALPVLAVLIAVLAAPGALAADGPAANGADAPLALAQTGVDADAVLLSVDLREDGSAAWRIEYRVRLDDENATAAFEDLQAAVEANESNYVSRFADRMAATVTDAEAATGREMALRNVSVDTATEQLPQTYGVLVYTFTWEGFAAVEGDRIRAGDALAGLFLDDDSTLLIAWPEGYDVAEVSPEPTERRERAVLWRGPTDFGPGEPSLVVAAGGPGGPDTSLLGLAVVVLVLAGGGALWWWRSRAAGESGPPADGGGDDRPPAELLSNEERVIALIEDHGGRMKQQDVVEALGWTDAKTSQVVGKLRESGQLEGFRLGRENVLRLPEVDDSPAPEDVSPPSDSEPDGG